MKKTTVKRIAKTASYIFWYSASIAIAIFAIWAFITAIASGDRFIIAYIGCICIAVFTASFACIAVLTSHCIKSK